MRVDGRPGRRGAKWFSYDVPVDASTQLSLVVTLNGDNRRRRTFDILVDGTNAGEVTLAQGSVSRFIEPEYPLPPFLVRGKQKVTIRFEATGGNEIAAVFGLRLIRTLA